MSSLWKHVAYEEELKPEVKALQEKLTNCKILMNQKVEWREIKRIVGMGRSTYFRYKNLERKMGIKGLVAKSKRPRKFRESKIPEATIDLVKKNRVERSITESPSHTTVQAMSHTAVSDLCLTKDVYMENKLFLSKYFKLRAW